MRQSTGTKTIKLNEEALAHFYSNPTDNSTIECVPNQYVVIQDLEEKALGAYLWDGKTFVTVPHRTFESAQFGKVKPKNNDPYQIAYMDSLERNQLTFATGPAGSAKSYLAFAYAFQELEKARVDRIVVFTNPFVARSAVKLGFLPGDKIDKLLDTSIGSILISKIGERYLVEEMINRGRIVLMPMGDCRGYEVPPHSFVYFTEAQNTDIDLMKLFLQRTTDDSKIVVEGDVKAQVDSEMFENGRNGLARAIEVFVGQDYAGHVELKTNYRGRISRKAEEM